MQFKLKFTLPNNNCLHVNNLTDSVGLDLLEDVKSSLNLDVLYPDQLSISQTCPTFNRSSLYIEINDPNILWKIPQFAAREIVEIIVEDGRVGKYWEMNITDYGYIHGISHIHKLFNLKRYKIYQVKFELNESQLIEDWIKDGCPDIWGNVDCEDINDDLTMICCKQRYSSENFVRVEHDVMFYGKTIKDVILSNSDYFDNNTDTVHSIIRKSKISQTIKCLLKSGNMAADDVQDILHHFLNTNIFKELLKSINDDPKSKCNVKVEDNKLIIELNK